MVRTGEEDETGTGYVVGQVAASAGIYVPVSLTMQDEGGTCDGREKRANIVFKDSPQEAAHLVGATAEPYRAGVPGSEAFVGDLTRGEDLQVWCPVKQRFSGDPYAPVEVLARYAPGVVVLLHIEGIAVAHWQQLLTACDILIALITQTRATMAKDKTKPGDEKDEGFFHNRVPGPRLPAQGKNVVFWSVESDEGSGREHEDLMLRRVPSAVAHHFRGGAGARGLTHAQYLTALVTLHESARQRADAGDTQTAAMLTELGLQTVSI
jgi:hypothetical protein